MLLPRILPASLFLFLCVLSCRAEPLRIANDFYTVSVNPEKSAFSIQSKTTGKTVLTDGSLSGTGGTAKVQQLTDKTFGSGLSIKVTYPNGNRETISLHPALPFVLFGLTLHNGGSEPLVVNHLPTVSAKVDLPSAEIKTLGTGGLLTPAENPGSYAFLAAVVPASRNGIVAGWITHDRGSGVVFSPQKDGAVRLQAQLDYGRLLIKPGADAATETFALGSFDDARLGLEAYADTIAKVYHIKLPPQPAGFCTWYTEKYSRGCDETHLPQLAAVAANELKPFGFDFVQIDDNWQPGETKKKNGPKKNFTTHDPKGPYPSGMKSIADKIKDLGLAPGIWFMPFAGTFDDPYFKDHQDWFAKGPDGKPFETAWGGTCLDMTNPGAREHLRGIVQRIAHDWGYTVFKMDGFWTGSATKIVYVNNGYKDDNIGEAHFSDPNVTNIEALRSGAKLVRETAGPGVYLLGCCVSQNMRSFGGSFGLLDGMRIGPDTAGRIGSLQGSRLWFLNGRVWHNDPDCVFVRASTPITEARLNASWAAISGQLFYDSDWIPDLPADRLDILKRCMPAHGLPARPVDVFENQPAQVWLLTDTRTSPRRDILALYNWKQGQAKVSYPLDRTGLPPAKEFVGFDFWANKFVPPFRDQVSADFSDEGCRILAVRPVSENPQLLSTSRHITQGMVDVAGEKWDAGSKTLSGSARVVANDPDELRIVVPAGPKSWKAKTITVSPEDASAGVTASLHQDGPKIRAKIISPASRDVHWALSFEPAPIAAPNPPAVKNLKAKPEYSSVELSWEECGDDTYRVLRNDGVTFESSGPEFTDASIEHGKQYTYTVAALGWNGAPASQVAMADVTTPSVLVPPKTVPPDCFLDNLTPVPAEGSTKVHKGGPAHNNRPLHVDKKNYDKGVCARGNALVVYTIPPGASRFVAVVGIDDPKQKFRDAKRVFEVYGDVKEMGEPPVLLDRSPEIGAKAVPFWAFNIELNARYKEIRLVVTGSTDGRVDCDWVDAGFVTGTKSGK